MWIVGCIAATPTDCSLASTPVSIVGTISSNNAENTLLITWKDGRSRWVHLMGMQYEIQRRASFLTNGWLSFHALMIKSRIYGDHRSACIRIADLSLHEPPNKTLTNEQQIDVPRGELRVVRERTHRLFKPWIQLRVGSLPRLPSLSVQCSLNL